VSAQSIPKPIQVEEFERTPNPPGGHYELHHGELVFVTYPVWQHKALQRRLRKLLAGMAEPSGFVVDTEYPYRPLPENEVWGADVACVSAAPDRVEQWLIGSPELVIEVKSPSNTKAELHDKAMTTLAGAGAVEFWIVDPRTRTVTVYSASSGMHVYGTGSAVPVTLFGGNLDVTQVFGDCE
jgi:Uma2 family endonuclease